MRAPVNKARAREFALLVLQLRLAGITYEELGAALEISNSTVRRCALGELPVTFERMFCLETMARAWGIRDQSQAVEYVPFPVVHQRDEVALRHLRRDDCAELVRRYGWSAVEPARESPHKDNPNQQNQESMP